MTGHSGGVWLLPLTTVGGTWGYRVKVSLFSTGQGVLEASLYLAKVSIDVFLYSRVAVTLKFLNFADQ